MLPTTEKGTVAVASESNISDTDYDSNKKADKISEEYPENKNEIIKAILGSTISLVVLYLISRSNYLLFHSIVESFSIFIGFTIFTIAWNSRRIMNSNFILFIGIASLFISAFGLLHTLSYSGMGVFSDTSANLATQLWIITRYAFSISLFAAVLVVRRKIYAGLTFVMYGLISALLIVSVFYWRNFPQAYIDGVGLTGFKITSEYIISGILLCTILLFIHKRQDFSKSTVRLVVSALIIAIASEMAFTLYADVFGLANVIGHLLSAVSFYLIYKALVQNALTKPYDLLFRNLKNSKMNLAKRATELTEANRLLALSLEERKKMQEQLEEYGKQLEILVEKKTKQLKEAERLAAIGQTAGMVGHDIRNPLQGIVSELYLERQEVASLPAGETKTNLQESIRSIEANIYYIDKIVSDLQDYARPLSPIKQKVKIEKAVADALTIVNIPDNVNVSINYEKDLPHVNADSVMLKRIIVNLVQNAVQAMPNGGELIISASRSEKNFLICVEDTGEGIPDEVKEKMFIPLFTTKSKGQGFGLAVVKRLTEIQDGIISYETHQGKGTKFMVKLPM